MDEEEKLYEQERLKGQVPNQYKKPLPKVDLLLWKSTEMLSISPQSGFYKKTIN